MERDIWLLSPRRWRRWKVDAHIQTDATESSLREVDEDYERGQEPRSAQDGGEGTVRLLAVGVDHRSAPALVREALAFGDVVLIAVPYGAYPQISKDYAQEFKGKTVIDAGNAVPARDGEIAKEARENGIGMTSAKYLAGARIVRAFNTLNYRRLTSISNRPEGRIAIPMAGDDKDALAVVSTLVRDAGFDPVIIGPLERAKDFVQGAPLYGQEITGQEMQQRLKALK